MSQPVGLIYQLTFQKLILLFAKFLNEIPRTMAKPLKKVLLPFSTHSLEGSSLLFSDLWGYNSTYPLNSLEKFWNENAFIEEAGVDGQVKLQVDIPPQSFPRLLGPLQDSDGRRMDSFWRKKNLRTFYKRELSKRTVPQRLKIMKIIEISRSFFR